MLVLTPHRAAIIEVLRSAKRTLTAADVMAAMRRRQPVLGRATVFRNLDALVEAGLAQRFERSGHVYAYASCSPTHHHHLVCTRCHKTAEVAEAVVAPSVKRVEKEHGFLVEH